MNRFWNPIFSGLSQLQGHREKQQRLPNRFASGLIKMTLMARGDRIDVLSATKSSQLNPTKMKMMRWWSTQVLEVAKAEAPPGWHGRMKEKTTTSQPNFLPISK